MTREMKNSGIEWIGEIPADWSVIKNKYLLSGMYSGGTPTSSNEDFYTDDGIPFVSISDMSTVNYVYHTKKALSENGLKDKNLQILDEGTLLYSIYATIGAVSELKIKATISQAILALILKADFHKEYYKYNLHAMKDYIFFSANGNTQFNLNAEKVWNFHFVLPSFEEQSRIADFLDKKCAEIDTVISKTQATIEEYKKLKQSVITEAVTKGIRGERPMKDSGIEWIGEIPADWDINSAFQLFVQVKNKNAGLVEKNLLSLSYGKIKRKSIDTIGGLLPESFDGYNIIEKDDIVLRLTDLQNDHTSLRVGLSTEKGIVTSAYTTLRNRSANLPIYLYYYLHSFDIAKGFYGMGAGVRQGLNWDGLKKLKIVIPTVKEQQEIVDYLEIKCAEIDKLIANKTQLLSELENYKKSVIYEYVTGKKDV